MKERNEEVEPDDGMNETFPSHTFIEVWVTVWFTSHSVDKPGSPSTKYRKSSTDNNKAFC